MVYVEGIKFSCQPCIKGHRSANCVHPDRPLFEVKKKGRPKTQCPTCQKKREATNGHARCDCPKDEPQQLVLPYGVPREGALAEFRATLSRHPSMSSTASSSAASSASNDSNARSLLETRETVGRKKSVSGSHRKDSNAALKPHDLAHGHSLASHGNHAFWPYPSHVPHTRSAPLTRSPSIGSFSHNNDLHQVVVNSVPPTPALAASLPANQDDSDIKPARFDLPPLPATFASTMPDGASLEPISWTGLPLPPTLPSDPALPPMIDTRPWSASSSEVDLRWMQRDSALSASGSESFGTGTSDHLGGDAHSDSPISPSPNPSQQSQAVATADGHAVPGHFVAGPDASSNPFDALVSPELSAEIDKWRQDSQLSSFEIDGTGPTEWTRGFDDVSSVQLGSLNAASFLAPEDSLSTPYYDLAPPPVATGFEFPRSAWPWVDDAFMSSSSNSSRAASSVAESDYSDYSASVDNLPSMSGGDQMDRSQFAQQELGQRVSQQANAQFGTVADSSNPAVALGASLEEFDLSLDRTDTLIARKPGQEGDTGYDEDDEYDDEDDDEEDEGGQGGFRAGMAASGVRKKKKKRSVMKRFFSSFA